MSKINLNTSKAVTPMIYAYSTPEIKKHEGWTKIGYTEHDVATRIDQQTKTADIEYKLEWQGAAIFDDGSYETFTDKDFHAYLKNHGVKREPGREWFQISGPDSRALFYDFRADHGILKLKQPVIPYTLRDEQAKAVEAAFNYFTETEGGEMLFNAKPRFGKTLTVYDLCKTIDAAKVLIVTNRPAIANSWYSDYAQFLGEESGYAFISETDSLKGKPGVMTRDEYLKLFTKSGISKFIVFLSLQDLKGSVYFGGKYDKLKYIRDMDWDMLVIDEAHEGVDTYKTDIAFDRITRKYTLHLSGTPFKALANDKFPEAAIFNWTYADEQKKKHEWDYSKGENPYENLPQLNLYTYQMSEIIRDQLERGVEINGETEEYAFDLNEFFKVDGAGRFVYNDAVNKFLDAMVTQEKFPFSTPELRNEIKHSFWLLNRVESARALAKKLNEHPVFCDYEIVLAAGDGRIDDDSEREKAFDKVKKAIKENDKTITLSVGQLTTGVTIPEWTAVMMLSNIASPSLYMQAAFRSQNPCLFIVNGQCFRKENAYVFDFDPARTLTIFEQFANDLYSSTASGHGDIETRKKHIKELLNFFPVIGEDEEGEMIALDAEKVLSIPRKIKSQEVVRRGFMSNYLFQNISFIFNAPKEVIEMISNFPAVAEPKVKPVIDKDTAENLSLDENGEVKLDEEYIIGQASELFGEKIYGSTDDIVDSYFNEDTDYGRGKDVVDKLKEAFKTTAVEKIIETTAGKYGDDLKKADERHIKSSLNSGADYVIDKTYDKYEIEKKTLEVERVEALRNRLDSGKTESEINEEFDRKQKEAVAKLQEDMKTAVSDFVEKAAQTVVETVETNIKKREKESIEDTVRDHLRGFSRTIPSFLMAYGDDSVTLATFDTIIPDRVFVEVTSISLDQFRFLRDGGKYIDEETGEEKNFKGNLFDPIVFDDSVKEFLRLKKELADYFDEKAIEDIFDYIPPQKTNQIFTPKDVVKRMADLLEQENPGCFDDAEKTFLDPYMKSGMYITEIVKRLYQSEKMKALFPDGKERLRHIFEKQVYGLAPTEIIYRIALSYILGFSDEIEIEKHNLRLADSLPYAKEGKLDELLEQLFG